MPLAGAGNQCTAGDLRPSWPGFGDGVSEHLFYSVNLQNVTGRACVTGGYVGVAAYDPAGHLIPAAEQRASMAPDVALSVGPGGSMHFSIGLPDVDIEAGGTECSTVVGALHLIPPNERTEVQVATPVSTGYPEALRQQLPRRAARERCDNQLNGPSPVRRMADAAPRLVAPLGLIQNGSRATLVVCGIGGHHRRAVLGLIALSALDTALRRRGRLGPHRSNRVPSPV